MQSTQDLDRKDRIGNIVNQLKDGETSFTAKDLSDMYDISTSQIHRDMKTIDEHGYPLSIGKGEHGANVYSMERDLRYLDKTELNELDDVAAYLQGEIDGTNTDIRNGKWKKTESIKVLALNETGWGTKFHDDNVDDAISYMLEQIREEEGEEYFEDNFACVINGGAHPLVPKWSYKTARQAQRALGTYDGKEPNTTAQQLADREQLMDLLDDDILPDDPDDIEEYVDGIYEELSEVIDLDESGQKITNLQDATDLVKEKIDQFYDSAGVDFDLYIHEGEQDELNIEDLEELKIEELRDQQKERMKNLEKKIKARNDALSKITDVIEGKHDEYDDLKDEIEQHIRTEADMDAKPSDLDLDDFEIEEDEDIYDFYQDALDKQNELTKQIRELEQNENAMQIEKMLGNYAKIFGRSYLEADQTELMRALAELEYEEYTHQIGNVKEISRESDLMRIDLGGFTVDVAHNMNLASNEPLKTGYPREIEKYKNRTDGKADLFLSGHHGQLKAEAYIHERGEDANENTWVVALPTLMDKELLEINGEDEGLNLLKDVKRKNKGLFDSAATLIELAVEEGPDGELRKRKTINIWDGEYLKNLGRQLNGEKFPGKDLTDLSDLQHIVARGDDQIGAPHMLRYMKEPLYNEVIEEDFDNIKDFIDRVEEDPSDIAIMEGGDTFQGNDIYPGQMTEGAMLLGDDALAMKEAIIRQFEEEDIEFESSSDFYNYLDEKGSLETDTMKALDYIEERNRAQMPVTDLGQQGELVRQVVADQYNELLEKGVEFVAVDGNHYNRNQEGMSEAKRIKEMLDSDFYDSVKTFSGLQDGDGTFTLGDDTGEGRNIRIKHRPTGRGRSHRDKQLSGSRAESTDVTVNYDKHVPGLVKEEDWIGIMPGSAQATNLFVKGLTSNPAERGAVYLSLPKDKDKNVYTFEHVTVKGTNPFAKDDE